MGNSVGEWLPVRTRFGLHLSVVALIGLSVLLGGGRLFESSKLDTMRAVPVPAPTAEPLPALEASLLLPPTAAPTVAATPMPEGGRLAAAAPVAPVAAFQGSNQQIVAEALSLPIEQQPTGLLTEEGVVAVRSLAAARGGVRAPAPTPTASPTPTPAPSPTPEPTKEPVRPQIYKVAEGDTLLAIAYRLGITPETILWANDLGNGELLQIGQELTILPVSGVLHRVRKGDTLLSIAEAYGAEAAKIVQANVLANADQLQEGQALVVPGGMMRTVAVSGLPAPPSAQELAAAPKHTVKQGDTLLSIADAFGVRASVIQVANGLLDPDMLALGQVLSIPGGRQPSAAPKPQAPAPRPQPAPPAPPPAPAPAPEPEPPADASAGDRIAAISQKYLGYRYVWGGTSPRTGFDCSGFAWYVYREAGLGIPRAPLESQLGAGPRISRDKLLPGDLVFFANTYKAGLSHVGIYLGGGRWINAESERVGIQIRGLSDPFWAARYVGASRPW